MQFETENQASIILVNICWKKGLVLQEIKGKHLGGQVEPKIPSIFAHLVSSPGFEDDLKIIEL